MNINENTDLIGFIVWLICSCNLGAFLFILFTWNLTLILSLGLYFLIFIAMVCFKFKDIKDMYYVVKKI